MESEEKHLGSDPAFAQGLAVGMDGGLFVSCEVSGAGGLTKRELFAAMAMQGICGDGIPGSHHRPEETARDAVAYADALLKELAK